jgi:hypothetical protein
MRASTRWEQAQRDQRSAARIHEEEVLRQREEEVALQRRMDALEAEEAAARRASGRRRSSCAQAAAPNAATSANRATSSLRARQFSSLISAPAIGSIPPSTTRGLNFGRMSAPAVGSIPSSFFNDNDAERRGASAVVETSGRNRSRGARQARRYAERGQSDAAAHAMPRYFVDDDDDDDFEDEDGEKGSDGEELQGRPPMPMPTPMREALFGNFGLFAQLRSMRETGPPVPGEGNMRLSDMAALHQAVTATRANTLPPHLLFSDRDFTDEDYEALLTLDEGVENRRGALQKEINALPTEKVSKRAAATSSLGKCPICLEMYAAGETLRRLSCKHCFHKGCLDKWLRAKAECPICRLKID